MNIAITGVHGVGKTTLFNKLLPFFDGDGNTVALDETPRHYIDATGFFINENANEVSQLLIAYKMAYQVWKLAACQGQLISDRCLIDCVVYTESLYRHGKFSSKFKNDIIELAIDTMPFFDLVLYVRPTIFAPIKDDGVRATDIAYRNSIQELFDDYVYRWLPARKIFKINGNEQELLQQALIAIDKFK